MRRPLLLVTLLTCALAAPAAASAQSEPPPGPQHESASAGDVSATLDWVRKTSYEATDVKLTITRAGTVVVPGASLDTACKYCDGAMPLGAMSGEPNGSLTVRDLDGDGTPEVIADLYTGGAHCCTVSVIYGVSPVRRLVHNWGDPSYRLVDLAGAPGPELLTADDRFAYAFCAYVCSLMPEVLYRYAGGKLVDVTREFPARIRKDLADARVALAQARRHRDEGYAIKGILPALCADLYRLGRGASCRRELHTALRRGELGGGMVDFAPDGAKYVSAVLAFLKKTGYR